MHVQVKVVVIDLPKDGVFPKLNLTEVMLEERVVDGREIVVVAYLAQNVVDITLAQLGNSLSDDHTTLPECLTCSIIKCCYFSCGSVRHLLLL